jgi:hypothetical protein
VLTVGNPATEEPIAELEQAGVDEADEAVTCAKDAYPTGREVAPADRARFLRRLATLVEENAEALAEIESRNVGKPISGARAEIGTAASKGAVLSMSRELAVQIARQGVRVNALCPGQVETPLLLAIFGDDPAAFARRQVHWPTGRLGKPREIVNAALFLASDESSFVNGAAFVVDGGITAAYVTPE